MPLDRTCSECGLTFPSGGYSRTLCNKCYLHAYWIRNRERLHAYQQEHHEERLAQTLIWRATHQEHRREYKRQYRKAHTAQQRMYDRAYYAAHRETIAKNAKAARGRDLEASRAKGRYYSARHRTANSARAKHWHDTHPIEVRESQHRRRARKRAGFVAPVSLDAIYVRDRGLCHLCRKPVSREQASLDHLIPLARGGTHEPRNVALAHRLCNIRRRHTGPAQTRLF